VLLGEAFFDTGHFQDYINEFVRLHDEREKNDWDSYHRLLTDYIGVQADGATEGWQRPVNCLRAALLGYLKTYEVVTGGNCLSCSHCVPDENFTASLDDRREVVTRLGPSIEGLLNKLASFADSGPGLALIRHLLEEISTEESRGRSLAAYVAGWTSRLLDDTPGHQAALWIRVMAMAEGLIPLQHLEFGESANKLASNAAGSELTELMRLSKLALEKAGDDATLCDLCANLAYRCGEYLETEDLCRRLIGPLRASASDDQLRRAYGQLIAIYSPSGASRDRVRYEEVQFGHARLSESVSAAEEAYGHLVETWSWERTLEEIRACEEEKRSNALLGLICVWAAEDTLRRSQAASHLDAEFWVLEELSDEDFDRLLECIGVELLGPLREVGPYLADRASARLRRDPGDVTAAWLRLEAMAAAVMPLDQADFAELSQSLLNVHLQPAKRPDLDDLSRLATLACNLEPEWVPLWKIRGDIAARANDYAGEAFALEKLASLFQGVHLLAAPAPLCTAYARLAELHDPVSGPLPSAERFEGFQLQLARLSQTTSEAERRYGQLIETWEWAQVGSEVEELGAAGRDDIILGLLCAWATDNPSRSELVALFLEDQLSILEPLEPEDIGRLVEVLGVSVASSLPSLSQAIGRKLVDLGGVAIGAKFFAEYVQRCLDWGNFELAGQGFETLLVNASPAEIRDWLRRLASRNRAELPGLLRRAVTLFEIIVDVSQAWPQLPQRIDFDHLEERFLPYEDVDKLDMLVSTLRCLSRRHSGAVIQLFKNREVDAGDSLKPSLFQCNSLTCG
jgi:hypothetical protein